ncbi:hypothetical protein ES708_26744 [subsurface metagenome]
MVFFSCHQTSDSDHKNDLEPQGHIHVQNADEETAMEQTPQNPDEGEITYLKEQVWKTEFATAIIKKQSFFEVIKTTGEILSALDDEISIPAKHSGTVVFLKSALLTG